MGRAPPSSTPWRALAAIVALAVAVGLAAQAAGRARRPGTGHRGGALRAPRRQAARRRGRGGHRRQDLRRPGRAVALPSLPARKGRAPPARRPARARSSTTSSSPSPASRARTRRCTRPSTTRAGPSWPRARATGAAAPRCWAATTTCAPPAARGRRVRPDATTRARSPASTRQVAGLDTLATAAARRAGGAAPGAGPVRRRGAWIDYRGPAGTIPSRVLLRRLRGRFPAERGPRPGGRGRRGGAHAARRPPHAGGDELMAGAEVQANAIWTAMHGVPLRERHRVALARR